MHRLKTLGVCMVVLSLVGIALAALTFHSGPTFTNTHDSWSSTANISGLGGDHVNAIIAATGTATYTCVNGGGNTAPGQKLVTSTTTGSTQSSTSANGRDTYSLTVTFAPAATVNGKTAGCPNGNWTGENPVIQGTPSAILTLSLASTGATVFGPSQSCPANTNGTCPGF